MHEVVTVETPGLGDRSYLIHDGGTAVVIDPQRDIDRMLQAAQAAGARISHVLETHIHNDYITGGLALAQAAGAAYVVAAGAEGGVSRGAGEGDPVAVFTGGSMLFGAVGRTDLISPEQTEPLARAQYRSVRRLADELPDQVAVYPTHGFGSFCSATPTSGSSSTIGAERRANVALNSDEDSFVKQLIAGLGAYPRYYAHMGPVNRRGPAAPDLSAPRLADAGELRRRIDAGEWVVDLRQRRAFARSHLTGSISVELGDPFATYLAWTMPWGTPLTLIGESPGQVAAAQLQLTRVGIDRLEAAAAGPAGDLAAGRLS